MSAIGIGTKIWMRVGDQDDYHDFNSVEHAAEALAGALEELHEFDVIASDIVRAHHDGVIGIDIDGTELRGTNAISLFWGDEGSDFEAMLSDEELREFAQLVVGG